jgi:hypothetical protein
MAVLLIPLFMLIILIWELGRLVQAEQVLQGACRAAARQAAQGLRVSLIGAFDSFVVHVGDPPATGTTAVAIEDIAADYIRAAGIGNLTGMVLTFNFVGPPPGLAVDGSRTQPWEGERGDYFRVRIRLPYDNFRWTSTGLNFPGFAWGITALEADLVWRSVQDEPFQLISDIPGHDPTAIINLP